MIIKNKEDIIKHFSEGNKTDQFIGVENEKFVFDKKSKKRVDYSKINDVLNFLSENFGWKKVSEEKNTIGLKLNDAQVTLEPGNQIELAGRKLNNIHEVCAESYKFQDQLLLACKKFDLEILSIGYDPSTNLKDVPYNPKKRYKIMSTEMPKKRKFKFRNDVSDRRNTN